MSYNIEHTCNCQTTPHNKLNNTITQYNNLVARTEAAKAAAEQAHEEWEHKAHELDSIHQLLIGVNAEIADIKHNVLQEASEDDIRAIFSSTEGNYQYVTSITVGENGVANVPITVDASGMANMPVLLDENGVATFIYL